MDSLSGFVVFVKVAETRSFVAAGKALGVSASAIGKRVARLEAKLAVRLFHRSTRSITLTAEGALFLERSRRILAEIEATEAELSQASQQATTLLSSTQGLVDRQGTQAMMAADAHQPRQIDRPFVGGGNFQALMSCGNYLDPNSCQQDLFWRQQDLVLHHQRQTLFLFHKGSMVFPNVCCSDSIYRSLRYQ